MVHTEAVLLIRGRRQSSQMDDNGRDPESGDVAVRVREEKS